MEITPPVQHKTIPVNKVNMQQDMDGWEMVNDQDPKASQIKF